jgi:F-type H+-transporting ATPase subunit a
MINNFAALELKVEISAPTVFSIGDFAVTNAMLTGMVGLLITLCILLYVGTRVRTGKYNRFVGLVQWVFEGLVGQISEIIPDKKLARKITPLACTIFFLVLINYWLSVLPGLDSVFINGVPLLRSPTADLNFVLGLSIVSVITVHIYAVKFLGMFGNAKRFFRNPIKDPIGAFEGILELVGEFSRVASLALRLFGNAFAGEILLLVIALLASYFATVALPIFMIFEMLIGFIQAYVFFVLTLIFTALAVSHHGDEETHNEHSPAVKSNMALQTE